MFICKGAFGERLLGECGNGSIQSKTSETPDMPTQPRAEAWGPAVLLGSIHVRLPLAVKTTPVMQPAIKLLVKSVFPRYYSL